MRSHICAYLLIVLILAVVWGCAGKDAAIDLQADPRQSPSRALAADFDMLTGRDWSGTLSYKDFTTSQPTTIRSSLRVTRTGSTSDPTWEMRFGYTEEPEAGSREVITLLQTGTMINEERVIERSTNVDGSVRLVTERDGEDNDRPARLRHVYVLSPDRCSIEKLVRAPGAEAFFQRNIYQWTR